ncbi:MAG: hypothetical protein ACR2PL_01225 [Dehalococcoidia bacterium]
MAERDPDFVAKAVAIIELEVDPPTDGPTFCVDEKTGIGVREPAAPSQTAEPSQPARREFEYVRHGTVDLLAAFCLGDGQRSAPSSDPSIAHASSASCWTASTSRRRWARPST